MMKPGIEAVQLAIASMGMSSNQEEKGYAVESWLWCDLD